jgi:predicted ATPase
MLFHKFCMCTYIIGSDLCGLGILKGARLTLKHGLSEYSPGFLPLFCTVCCGILNDPRGASKIGEDALVLMSKLNSRATMANTKFVVGSIAFPWTKPFSNILPLLLESYQDGMSTGDSESAGYVRTPLIR